MQQILSYPKEFMQSSSKIGNSPGSKSRRRQHQYHPTFTSSLVSQIMKPFQSPFVKKYVKNQNEIKIGDTLDNAKNEFINRRIGNSNEKSSKKQQQVNIFNTKIPKAASRGNFDKKDTVNTKIPQKFNYTNQETIHKKQAKDFNIISLVPQEIGKLRQYHNLTSEDKVWLKTELAKINPEIN